MFRQKIILVAGPTAAGKSALALRLATQHDGAIINADAMQIYAGLPILTAQPTPEELKNYSHALYGVFDPAAASSAGIWLQQAREAIEKSGKQSRTPILVGGTGLYFRALLGGLAEIPSIPKEVRDEAEKIYEETGEEKFRALLAAIDPASAQKLARNDRQRLIRAYEVARHTGKPLSQWHVKSSDSETNYEIETHVLLPPREELYAACDLRFTAMIERGAVQEAENFLKRGLDPALPAMKTIGLREIGGYLAGRWSLDEAIAKAQQATRNYAKRQMTWFRNQKLSPIEN